MARPTKKGLDYFPFDVDFFEDEKIAAISGEFGLKGEIVAVKLLCAIYRNGYFILWSDMLRLKILRDLPGVSPDLLDKIVNRLVRWEFFDKALFDSVGVLTSRGIQKRYLSVARRRTGTEEMPYLVVDVDGNPLQSELLSTETPQSKVNERKKHMKLYKKVFVNLAKVLPDSIYLRMVFFSKLKRKLNLSNPKSYNEKLNWLKINDRKEHYQIMVDKYEAKKYVADKIGEQYVIPTYGVWDRFEDIDFSKLPSNFVLKTTHDSGGVVLINDKNNMDIDKTKDVLEKSLKNNYYYLCREWPYKNLRHRIIAEKMITNTVPNDYKFFMFNGKMDSVMVCTNRASGHPTFRFYDKEWNRLLYQKPELEPESNVERPENYEKMIRIAEQLSENLVHMRVDLYNIDGQIYFGELTFFDQGGFDTDITLETDLKWGELMDLEKIK